MQTLRDAALTRLVAERFGVFCLLQNKNCLTQLWIIFYAVYPLLFCAHNLFRGNPLQWLHVFNLSSSHRLTTALVFFWEIGSSVCSLSLFVYSTVNPTFFLPFLSLLPLVLSLSPSLSPSGFAIRVVFTLALWQSTETFTGQLALIKLRATTHVAWITPRLQSVFLCRLIWVCTVYVSSCTYSICLFVFIMREKNAAHLIVFVSASINRSHNGVISVCSATLSYFCIKACIGFVLKPAEPLNGFLTELC